MPIGGLYFLTIAIWGTTWIAMKWQLGVVSAEVSIFYRLFGAALVTFIFSKFKGYPLQFSCFEHIRMFGLSLFLFFFNYLACYYGMASLPSGLVAVIFASASGLSLFFELLFFRRVPSFCAFLGSLCGLIGVTVLFWPELASFSLANKELWGSLCILLGTCSFSVGNLLSASNQKAGLPIIPSTAYSMLYGSCLVGLFILFNKIPFGIEYSLRYLGSLIYLIVLGSVVAFLSYLALVGRIGPHRASYTTVFFPVIALSLSMVFEGLAVNYYLLIGMGLTLLGNVIILNNHKLTKRSREWLFSFFSEGFMK